ncbi:hypothetical protein [Novosphingobium sp. G106]|uniref:hypothetical protein n=1 Tax=Novosphingobium sp. G106 TaxID=2849500 RepID=UPI0020C3169E|nr:hypothetical protein [Novosphingobium sp. G106]
MAANKDRRSHMVAIASGNGERVARKGENIRTSALRHTIGIQRDAGRFVAGAHKEQNAADISHFIDELACRREVETELIGGSAAQGSMELSFEGGHAVPLVTILVGTSEGAGRSLVKRMPAFRA